MPNYVKAPSLDLSRLKGEEFQIALRVAINDLRDRESIFSEFINEAGNPDKSNWERTIQYSHLHLLFAQTIVSTLLVEGDRRIITQTSAQPRLGAATFAAMRLAQGQLRKSEMTSCEPTAALPESRDHERIAHAHQPQRNHARIDREHQIGFGIQGASIIKRRWIIHGEHALMNAGGCFEPHSRWSQAIHWEFRARLIRAASGKLTQRDNGDRSR
jgi:hypothetical protein